MAMGLIGSLCFGFVIGWSTLLIVKPVRPIHRRVTGVVMFYLLVAVCGITFLANVGTPMIDSRMLAAGFVVGTAGFNVMKHHVKKNSTH